METQQQDQQVQTPAQPVKKRKQWNLRGVINSPWLLLAGAIIVGGIYLIAHPEYVALAMNYPFSSVFMLAIPLCLFLVKLIINFFSVIEKWIRLQFERARKAKRGQFLEFVIAVFMFVSVTEAGPMFNKLQGYALGGALGYITVFAFDLVAVVCMKSRAKMLRKGHDGKARIYQLGVWLCALVSVFANLYEAIQNAAALSTTNPLTFFAPLAGIAFPVMIIFLSYATDADEDDVDDPEVYRAEQEKRVAFVKAKREIAAAILAEKVQMNLLKQREFFLKGWLFTRKKVNQVIEVCTEQVLEKIKADLTSVKQSFVTDATKEVRNTYSTQIEQLKVQITELTSQNKILFDGRTNDQQEYRRLIEQEHAFVLAQLTQFTSNVRGQIDELHRTFGQTSPAMFDECIERVLSVVRSELDELRFEGEEDDDSEQEEAGDEGGLSNRNFEQGGAFDGSAVPSDVKRSYTRSTITKKRSIKRGKVGKKTIKIPAIEQVRAELEENPNITVSEISLRTGLAKGTISPLRTQVLEQMAKTKRSDEQHDGEQTSFEERSETVQTDPALEQIVVA